MVEVDLVQGNHDGRAGGLGVVDRLDRRRHHPVVGGDDENDDVRQIRAAGPHRGESRVAGRIQEGDPIVPDLDAICPDVLGDAARLALGDVGLANAVQEARLSMIDVAQYRDDRRAGLYVLPGESGKLFG